MRDLTEMGIPFAFSFVSWNSTKGTTEGVKCIEKAMLRPGYRNDQSTLADELIGYIEYPSGKQRFFRAHLLVNFNGHDVTP